MSDQSRVAGDGNEAESLREVAKYLEMESNRLLGVIENLQRDKQDWKNDVLKLTNDKADLQKKIGTYLEHGEQLRKEIKDLNARLEKRNQAHEQEKENRMKEEKKLKEENAKLRQELQEMKKKLEETRGLRKEEKKLKEENAKLGQELQEMKKNLEEPRGLRKEEKKLKEENTKLGQELQEMKKKLEEPRGLRTGAGAQEGESVHPDGNLPRNENGAGAQDGRNVLHEEVPRDENDEAKLKADNAQLLQQLQEKTEKLKERDAVYVKENSRLREELSTMQRQLTDMRQRLAMMASDRISKNNPSLEDLNDPFRPTVLAAQWENLFRSGEYWVVYEEIDSHLHNEFSSTWLLYDLCKVVYEMCAEAVGKLMKVEVFARDAWLEKSRTPPNKIVFRRDIRDAMRKEMKKYIDNHLDASERTPLTPQEMQALSGEVVESCISYIEGKVEGTKQVIRQRIAKHLSKKDPPPALLQAISSQLGKEISRALPHEKLKYDEFVKQVYHLCFRMLTKEVPMAVRFDAGARMAFDPSLYDNEQPEIPTDENSVIDLVLRPPLLRFEGGPVLVKGLVQVVPPTTEAKTADPSVPQDESGIRHTDKQQQGTQEDVSDGDDAGPVQKHDTPDGDDPSPDQKHDNPDEGDPHLHDDKSDGRDYDKNAGSNDASDRTADDRHCSDESNPNPDKGNDEAEDQSDNSDETNRPVTET